ncbi:MAG TPA: hypothetical protein VKP89_18510 [Burkholderiales bacterium]|nr:hypothetical protein [Burkholderiales bacterium]
MTLPAIGTRRPSIRAAPTFESDRGNPSAYPAASVARQVRTAVVYVAP